MSNDLTALNGQYQIPKEALGAAAHHAAITIYRLVEPDTRAHELTEDELGEVALAAIRAALAAWPGMHTHEWQRPWLGGISGQDIVLPITENTNAEA